MSKMKDLFGDEPYRPTYPEHPGHVKDSETSLAAADSVAESAETVRGRIHALIKQTGLHGMTCDEVEVALDGRHQTVSARIRELVLAGRIKLRGGVVPKRLTRSGREANIYIST